MDLPFPDYQAVAEFSAEKEQQKKTKRLSLPLSLARTTPPLTRSKRCRRVGPNKWSRWRVYYTSMIHSFNIMQQCTGHSFVSVIAPLITFSYCHMSDDGAAYKMHDRRLRMDLSVWGPQTNCFVLAFTHIVHKKAVQWCENSFNFRQRLGYEGVRLWEISV